MVWLHALSGNLPITGTSFRMDPVKTLNELASPSEVVGDDLYRTDLAAAPKRFGVARIFLDRALEFEIPIGVGSAR